MGKIKYSIMSSLVLTLAAPIALFGNNNVSSYDGNNARFYDENYKPKPDPSLEESSKEKIRVYDEYYKPLPSQEDSSSEASAFSDPRPQS